MPIPSPDQLKAISKTNQSTSLSFYKASTPTNIQRNHSSVTNQQRIKLCKWWADDSYKKREHKDAIKWFKQKFGQVLTISIISNYLG
jgi:hypothetical protein